MGEVYRAKDTKLNREVALKVLPESFTHDAERVARFRREAQVLASLNHPHIAHIHGLEEGPVGRDGQVLKHEGAAGVEPPAISAAAARRDENEHQENDRPAHGLPRVWSWAARE